MKWKKRRNRGFKDCFERRELGIGGIAALVLFFIASICLCIIWTNVGVFFLAVTLIASGIALLRWL